MSVEHRGETVVYVRTVGSSKSLPELSLEGAVTLHLSVPERGPCRFLECMPLICPNRATFGRQLLCLVDSGSNSGQMSPILRDPRTTSSIGSESAELRSTSDDVEATSAYLDQTRPKCAQSLLRTRPNLARHPTNPSQSARFLSNLARVRSNLARVRPNLVRIRAAERWLSWNVS